MEEEKMYREHVYQGNQEGMHRGPTHSFNVCQQSLFTTCGFLALYSVSQLTKLSHLLLQHIKYFNFASFYCVSV